MNDVTIHREGNDTNIRYVARVTDKEGHGELTMAKVRDGLYVAGHTGVPVSMGGKGLGTRLVEYMIEDARKNGFRVIPKCPFIAEKWKDHESWSDVLTKET